MMAKPAARPKDLAPKRLDRLRAILHQNHVARVDELCEALRVSAATVRRDLEELERRGEARRVHGGAVSVGQRLEEPLFDDKTAVAQHEKHRIAKAAADLIEAGDTVYLDGGSTVLELARLLRDWTNISVVTNSLRAAWDLAGRGPEVLLIGGALRRLSQTMVGPTTRFMLDTLNIDKAFMGTMGLSLTEGLTTTDPGEAYTKELVMRRARTVILLADNSKMGKVTFAHAGNLEDVDVLICDEDMEAAFTKGLTKKGVRVIQV